MISDDIRLGDIITEDDNGDIILLGFPYDEGVRRNNGRIFGKEAHQQLEERVTHLIRNNKIPFVVGGGNDQSYPNASGLLNNSKSIYVINIDAHLDVRPLKEGNKAHSGSPFRQLIEDERFHRNPSNRFIEFASQGSQCSIEHVNYLRSKSPLTNIIWYQTIRDDPLTPFQSIIKSAEEQNCDIFVSFDIDSIISASCPGVSAPASVGLSAQQACDLAFIAGQSFHVKLMDMSEYNPIVEEYRTGKLITLIFYHFILGRAKAIRDSQ
ncbi:unnamed protein product [Adineta ricciae]|uniref:Arginase n=1 Tax=Adineta ricciae TaxID=249248 RepID=A0A815SRG8_ADIRI|nr:unnamed protein product [Adineta ricciae]